MSDASDAAEPAGVAAWARRVRFSPIMRETFALALINRVVLFLAVWLSLRTIPRLKLYPDQVSDSLVRGHPFLDGWTRWDAVHYVRIAERGYPHGAGVAFFPLFPLLERWAVSALFLERNGRNLAIAGIAIANLCFLIAVPLFASWTAARFGEETARFSATMLCLTPFGLFFSAAYTESTFLLLVVASLASAQRRRWGWAGALAGLASGTRVFGLALTPALLVQAWRDREPARNLAQIGLTAPAGAVAYFVYCGFALDDLLAPVHAQAGWGGWQVRVWGYVKLFVLHPHKAIWGDARDLSIVLNLIAAALFALMLPLVWKKLDVATALFTTLIVAQVALTWVSLGRYLLPAVGVYVAAGVVFSRPALRGWPRDAFVFTSAIAQGVLAVLFSHGYWIV